MYQYIYGNTDVAYYNKQHFESKLATGMTYDTVEYNELKATKEEIEDVIKLADT